MRCPCDARNDRSVAASVAARAGPATVAAGRSDPPRPAPAPCVRGSPCRTAGDRHHVGPTKNHITTVEDMESTCGLGLVFMDFLK